MASNGSLFLSYIDSINQSQWAQLGRFFHLHFRDNDRHVDLDNYISNLVKSASLPAVKKTVDIMVEDDKSGQLGARLITRKGGFEYPEHVLCRFEDGKIKDVKSITDMDVFRDHVSHIVLSPGACSNPADTDTDLAQMYTSYISCINNQTMGANLHKYCHPHVTWCGRQLPLDEYRMLMEDSFSAIQGLIFKVRHLVVDKAAQRLAVRIEFSGTPVKEYAGVEPSGTAVTFSEHAFYRLEQGKIREVSTVIDWESYRRQMRET
jgi:predicted ester cyclase